LHDPKKEPQSSQRLLSEPSGRTKIGPRETVGFHPGIGHERYRRSVQHTPPIGHWWVHHVRFRGTYHGRSPEFPENAGPFDTTRSGCGLPKC